MMHRTRAAKLVALLSAVAALALAGCGGKFTRVTGQVVENGRPRSLRQGESVQLDFKTADKAPLPLSLGVFARSDGSFVADMNDGSGRGILPGTYKVRLNHEGTSLSGKPNARLFREAQTVEVAQGRSLHLTVDLTAGTIQIN